MWTQKSLEWFVQYTISILLYVYVHVQYCTFVQLFEGSGNKKKKIKPTRLEEPDYNQSK